MAREALLSRITRLILLANLASLAILVAGAMLLDGSRELLVAERLGMLRATGYVLVEQIVDTATDHELNIDPYNVGVLFESWRRFSITPNEQHKDCALRKGKKAPVTCDERPVVRVRLFGRNGQLVPGADSASNRDEIVEEVLAPGEPSGLGGSDRASPGGGPRAEAGARGLAQEIERALRGEVVESERLSESGERVLSVSLPVRRVSNPFGVVNVETTGVDGLFAQSRQALLPFIVMSVVVTVVSATLLTVSIARPLRRLASAADQVRRRGPRRGAIPDLSARRDEIGALSRALATMTDALADRIDAIERFAADVAHEIKNPLTSLRSAVDTLPAARDEAQRERLLGVIRHDVVRLDRLISDISNASRLDAELARARAERFDLAALAAEIVELYGAIRREGEAEVRLEREGVAGPLMVQALEGPLGQVFRNLIDNAKTFSPPGGLVRLRLLRQEVVNGPLVALASVEDDGPGIPEENLERIFERFYTERPKGAAFGSHSGLGLAIARQIVDAQGGRLWAENRKTPDGACLGARFVVRLPLARP